MEQEFETILNRMLSIYKSKNKDYGNSFQSTCDKFGILAPVIRLTDKLSRIESLINKENEVKDESMEDTLLDLANYSIMTLLWLKNKNKINHE